MHVITWPITDEAGNNSQCSYTITVNEPANILSYNDFLIYPNPTDGKFSIELTKPGAQISIIDFTGKTVLRKQTNQNI